MKKLCKNILLFVIILIFIFGCDNKESENIAEVINNTKSVIEYPDTATVDDFDTIEFGEYEQDGNIENGKEKIKWLVLDKDEKNNKIILISKNILDYHIYVNGIFDFYEDYMNWEKSDIRKFLNKDFYENSFNKSEKKLIAKNETQYIYFQNDKNKGLVRKEGKCVDKVFFLDENDIRTYFKNKESRITKPTLQALYNYEEKHGAPLKCIKDGKIDKDILDASTWLNGYYLRNFSDDDDVYYVEADGSLANGYSNFEDDIKGLRPVITLDCAFSKDTIISSIDKQINSVKSIKEFAASDLYKISSSDFHNDHNIFETVRFGEYYFTSNEKKPVEWFVLEKKNDKALLLSKNIIDAKYFNEGRNFEYWGNSNVRAWLNDELFNNIFSDEEKSLVIESDIKNGVNQYNGVESGNDTKDFVFLLNYDEVRKYFSLFASGKDNSFLSAKATEYTKKKYDANDPSFYHDSFLLRDIIDNEKSKVLYVDSDGAVLNTTATKKLCGIRPAIWIKFKNENIIDENKTNINNNTDLIKSTIDEKNNTNNFNVNYFDENKLDFTYDVNVDDIIEGFIENSKFGNSILTQKFKDKYYGNEDIKTAKVFNDNLIIAIEDEKSKVNDMIIIFDNELNILKEYPKYCCFATDEKGRIFIKSRIYNEDIYYDKTEYNQSIWDDERLSGFNIIDNDLSLMFKVPINSILCQYASSEDEIVDMNRVLINDNFQTYIYIFDTKEVEEVLTDIGFEELRLNEPNLYIVEKTEISNSIFYNTIGEQKNYILHDYKQFGEQNIVLEHNKYVEFATDNSYFETQLILKSKQKKENESEYYDYYNINLDLLGTDYYDNLDEILCEGKKYEIFIPLDYGYYIYKYEVYDKTNEIKVYLKNGNLEREVIVKYDNLCTIGEFNKKFRYKHYDMRECLLFNRNDFYDTTNDYYDYYDINSNTKIFSNVHVKEIYVQELGDDLPYKDGLVILTNRKDVDDRIQHHSELYFLDDNLHEIKEKVSFVSEVKKIKKQTIKGKIFLKLQSGRHYYLLNLNSLLFYKYHEKMEFTNITFNNNTIELEYNGNEKIIIDENYNIIK